MAAAKVTPEGRKLKEKDIRREEIAQDHANIQRAERFILQVYYIVDKNVAMTSLLEYEPALEKFNEYITYEANNCAFTLQFWHSLRHLEHQQTDIAVFRLAKNLTKCYFTDPGEGNRVLVSNFAKQSVINVVKKEELVMLEVLEAFKLVHTELVAFLSNLYTKFLQSKYYTSWRCQERGHAAGLALQYVLKYADTPTEPRITKGLNSRIEKPKPQLKIQVEDVEMQSFSTDNQSPNCNSPEGDRFPMPKTSIRAFDPHSTSISSNASEKSRQKDGDTVTNRIRNMASVMQEEDDHSWTQNSVALVPKTEDLANAAFQSMELSKLSKLISCESRWLIILLAGMENIPLSFSLHAASTSKLGGRKGAMSVQFPYLYANRFHERMGDVHRRLIKNKPMHALFDVFSEVEKKIKDKLKLEASIPNKTSSKGLLTRSASLLDNVVDSIKGGADGSLSSLSKQFTSVKVNHSRFFKPKPLPFVPSTATDVLAFYDNILAGNPSILFVRVQSQANRSFLRKSMVIPVNGNSGGSGSAYSASDTSNSAASIGADDTSRSASGDDFGAPRSIVFGVKPIVDSDKKVIYFLTFQFVVANDDDCVQEKFHVDDLLSLLPDTFPEKDVDDLLQGMSLDEEDEDAEVPAAAPLAASKTPNKQSFKNMFSLASPKKDPEPEKPKKKAPLRHVHGYGSYGSGGGAGTETGSGSSGNTPKSSTRDRSHKKESKSVSSFNSVGSAESADKSEGVLYMSASLNTVSGAVLGIAQQSSDEIDVGGGNMSATAAATATAASPPLETSNSGDTGGSATTIINQAES